MPERFSVDSKSYDLAEHFLPDSTPEVLKRQLAQVIQDAVEDWYGAHEVELGMPSATADMGRERA